MDDAKPIPTAMISSLGYLLGGSENSTQSGGKLRDPSPYQRRPTANVSEPTSSVPTLRNNGYVIRLLELIM